MTSLQNENNSKIFLIDIKSVFNCFEIFSICFIERTGMKSANLSLFFTSVLKFWIISLGAYLPSPIWIQGVSLNISSM